MADQSKVSNVYETKISDVLALAEMKSSIPAQLTELLDLEMNGLSFDYVLNFSENIRSGEVARGLWRAIIFISRDAINHWCSSSVVGNC